MATSMMAPPAVEEAAATTRRRPRGGAPRSSVWDNYTINTPADGGARTATCRECLLTLSADSKNGTTHLHRHTKSKKCQQLAAEREVGRRQPTSPPATAAEPPPGPDGGDADFYSPSPPVVVVVEEEEEEEEEEHLFTVDGLYIPELFDKLIAEGLGNLDEPNVPVVAQAASSSTKWFINKKKEMQVKRAETKKRCAPDDESGLHVSAQPDFNLRGKRRTSESSLGLPNFAPRRRRWMAHTAGATATIIQDQDYSHHVSNEQ